MNKKIDIKIVIILIIGLFFAEHAFFKNKKPIKDNYLKINSKSGKEKRKLVDSIFTDTIYIEKYIKGDPIPQKKEIIVDSIYKSKYEEALKKNDSLEAKNLFLESISLDTWDGTLINNNDIRIDGTFVTRGKLLEYDVKYKIKKDSIKYNPKVVSKFPKLSIVGGVNLGMPIDPVSSVKPVITAHIGIRGKKGNTFTLGLDSQKRAVVGYEWTLFKTKN